jgi:ferredoxin
VSRVYRIVLNMPAGPQSFDCSADEFIWNAAARANIILPAICHQGRCLTCAARLLSGEVDQSAAVSYFPEDRVAGFVLLCTARPLTDLIIEPHQQWAMREYRKARGLPAPYS